MRDFCPGCGRSMVGEPVPVELWDLFPSGSTHTVGGAPHYSRWVGQWDLDLHCWASFHCPDCMHVEAAA